MNLIPVNNNLNKLIAFTPSLDPTWRKNNRIYTNPEQIETVEVIENLQKEGWSIKGSQQAKGKNGKVNQNLIKLEHQDLNVGGEGFATLTLKSKLNGAYDINSQLGMLRLVCENGLVTEDELYSFMFNSQNQNYDANLYLNNFLKELEIQVPQLSNEVNEMGNVLLENNQQQKLANLAMGLRFNYNNSLGVNKNDLLKVNRKEDEGNGLWKVFNRIQENVTKPGMLIDKKGRALDGIRNPYLNTKINQVLYGAAVKLAN